MYNVQETRVSLFLLICSKFPHKSFSVYIQRVFVLFLDAYVQILTYRYLVSSPLLF